jgi:hypothetical protein
MRGGNQPEVFIPTSRSMTQYGSVTAALPMNDTWRLARWRCVRQIGVSDCGRDFFG